MAGLKEQNQGRGISVDIVRAHASENFQAAIQKAREVLLTGGMVVYPTESFYGLGVDSSNHLAIQRLFRVKRRQADQPILILIPTMESVSRYAKAIPSIAWRLMDAFWPGGLTLVFEAGPKISPLLTGQTGKIGIRLSSHPVAAALARAMRVPITGTSANVSGEPACRNSQEVLASLGENVDLILDGGEALKAEGSTVIDITINPPRILRQGMVPKSQLEEYITF